MIVDLRWGYHRVLLRRRLGARSSLREHEETIRRVVVVRVEGPRRRFRIALQWAGTIAHLLRLWLRRGWRLRRDRLRRLRLGVLLAPGLGGGGADGGPVKVYGARRRCDVGEESLRVGARGREHRPAAARCEARSQVGFVWRRKAATDVVTEVVGRPRQHRRAQRACPERAACLPERGAAAGEEGRRRRDGGDGGELGAAGGLGRAAKRLLEGVRLQIQRAAAQSVGEVVGRAVARGRLLLGGTRRGSEWLGGFGIGRRWQLGLGVGVDLGLGLGV